MKDKQSRRRFLKLAAPTGGLLLWQLGCGGAATSLPTDRDGGGDSGGSDSGSRDAGFVDQGTDAGTDAGMDAETDAGTDAGSTCQETGSDVEGPFHIENAPSRTQLAGIDEPGERIVVEGTVYESDCRTPVAGVLLDVWHADATGAYDDSAVEYRLRGQMRTDEEGRYRFESIKPGRYPLGDSTRPAHIHFIVSKPGFVPLTTQMYFLGDPFLSPNDPCGNGCNSGDPTLIVDFAEQNGVMLGQFDIVLGRDG